MIYRTPIVSTSSFHRVFRTVPNHLPSVPSPGYGMTPRPGGLTPRGVTPRAPFDGLATPRAAIGLATPRSGSPTPRSGSHPADWSAKKAIIGDDSPTPATQTPRVSQMAQGTALSEGAKQAIIADDSQVKTRPTTATQTARVTAQKGTAPATQTFRTLSSNSSLLVREKAAVLVGHRRPPSREGTPERSSSLSSGVSSMAGRAARGIVSKPQQSISSSSSGSAVPTTGPAWLSSSYHKKAPTTRGTPLKGELLE